MVCGVITGTSEITKGRRNWVAHGGQWSVGPAVCILYVEWKLWSLVGDVGGTWESLKAAITDPS